MNYLKQTYLLLLLCGLSFSAVAREMAFEQNWIQFEEGRTEFADLYFDVQTDVLTVKGREGVNKTYRADKVVSFSYGEEVYYSLPLNGGYSFFQILHEGTDFAVLLKPANLPLLQFFVEQSKGTLQLCEDPANPGKKVLCEGSIGPSFGMPTYTASVEYDVEDALFVAVGGKIELVSCKYDTKGATASTEVKGKKSNKYVLKRLKEVMQDKTKMQALRAYVASTNADLEDSQQLVKALQSVYH